MSLKLKTAIACSVVFSAFAGASVAQDVAAPSEGVKGGLAPNLTVTFNLNSTLGSKETAYYRKVVERMLSELPQSIELTEDEAPLLHGSNEYARLGVVAYLPAEGEEDASNYLNKVVKNYDILFELPKQRRLEIQNDPNSRIKMPLVSLNEFMGEGAAKDISKTETPTVVAKVEPKSVGKPKVQKKTAEKVKVANKSVQKKNTKPAKSNVVKLRYLDDSSIIPSKSMPEVKKLASELKAGKVKSLKVTTGTMASPFTSWEDVRDSRMAALKKEFLKNDVDLQSVNVSYIHVKSDIKQFVNLEVQ